MLYLTDQNKDLVSIIVPAYNAEAFLQENIESLLGQTYKNLEVIYICDGCTDNTINILTQYTQDVRLKILIETENHGAAISRNIGMDVAKGDWIIFFDADDLMEPNTIEDMVERAIKSDADMCCCYWERFEEVPNKDAVVANKSRKLCCKTYPIAETQNELQHIMQLVDKGPLTKLVHKSIYKKENVYFQNIPNSNDVYYSMVSAMESKRIAYVDKVLIHYRSDVGRKTLTTERNKRKSYIFEAYAKVYCYILKRKDKHLLLKSFYNDVCSSILYYLNKPVGNYLIDLLRDKYINEWEMYEHSIENDLSYVNRILLREIMSGNQNICKQDIIMMAKVEFVRSISEEECAIWGTGLLGEELLEKISSTDIKIKHVFDSAQDKWGKRLHGYLIENFTEAKVENIIVTTPQYYDAIRRQIENRAINIYNLEEKIWEIPD